ncbi:hypothetical protein SAMN05216215_104138 [Saccharopolyspora shandongensis]|uniref:Uncharacterized protein n=1 Tax=Saccharopolyspora shandongensis TaxID=418495 RepID=A0A1H3PC57_9PSEU|nr:hypothetical protein SAMN05216215_104138 [Saccharopolyspora shandongensis]
MNPRRCKLRGWAKRLRRFKDNNPPYRTAGHHIQNSRYGNKTHMGQSSRV